MAQLKTIDDSPKTISRPTMNRRPTTNQMRPRAKTINNDPVKTIDNGPEINSNPVIHQKPTINQMKARDAELVRGRFTFLEAPGATLEFRYRKYKGDSAKLYKIKDGEVCTIPRGVAKHLATSGSYPIHEYATDEFGKPIIRIGRMKKRYNFESLEFFDDEPSRLYTVEKL